MARYDRPKAVDDIVGKDILPNGETSANIILGMSVMSIAMLAAPGMDVVAKYLGTVGEVSPGIVTFGRFLVQAVSLFVLLSIMKLSGSARPMWPKNMALNLLRGAMMGTAAFLFFTAVTFMPVADAIAIFFVEPFILTVLSAIILGETVGWRRRIAVLVGFGGALLVIQPSFEQFGLVALLPVLTAFIFANYLILTRKVAKDDDPIAMQFVAGIGGTIVVGLAVLIGGGLFEIKPLQAEWPDSSFLWSLVIILGLLGTASHIMIVFAFARAPASILAPFQYMEIVSATALGLLVFGEFPNTIKWVGIVIIVASGFYIFWREAQISRTERIPS